MKYITDQHPSAPGKWALCEDGSVLSLLPSREKAVLSLTADAEWTSLVAASENLVAWEGILAFTGTPTSDRRQLEPDGATFRTFPLPLMAQTKTAWGHEGAHIVGRIDTASEANGEIRGTGVFDSGEDGMEAARLVGDQMLDRVSIDLGAAEVETEIMGIDAEGWPIDWLDRFMNYEIMGATQVAFSAFGDARIALAQPDLLPATPEEEPEEEPVVADAAPIKPPSAWFQVAEPVPGQPFHLGDDGSEWLVEQDDGGAMAMPLQITDDGLVLGHIGYWGQCHVGYPGKCISPPTSPSSYSRFHIGYVETAEGDQVTTGALTAGCDHAASRLRAPEALSHYANNGVAWADVRIIDGVYGPWACGVLRPDVTEEQVRIYRAGALSGDWRAFDGKLDLIATLAVNNPGFPIARESVTASGDSLLASVSARQYVNDGEVLSLTAAAVVKGCKTCGGDHSNDLSAQVAQLRRQVATLTRLMAPEALARMRSSLD